MPEFTLVENPGSIIADIAGPALLGIDTEFVREKTYFAELCLVQISTGTAIYCVDPLQDTADEGFWGTLMDKHWIVHSARQDIEVLYQNAQRMPQRLFDTQIGAALLGMTPQLGYAGVVKELLGIEIPKLHTRADWSRRPLPSELLEYAAEDVEYLLPVFDILKNRLRSAGRLAWAEEDSAALLDPALYEIEPRQAISRLKGAKNLRGRQRGIAARIAAWREDQALRKNLPRQWILRDRSIIEIARKMPRNINTLADIEGVGAGTTRRYGRQLLSLIADSADVDIGPSPAALTDSQKQLIKKLQQLVAECAADLGIAAEIIAGKKEIASIVQNGDFTARLFSGWRRDTVGGELCGLLESL